MENEKYCINDFKVGDIAFDTAFAEIRDRKLFDEFGNYIENDNHENKNENNKIDYEKIKKDCGLDFAGNERDLLFYIQSILYNLKIHNKNYTKEQYERICLLADIFDCIE